MDDDVLVTLIRSRDEQGIKMLYQKYRAVVFGSILRVVNDHVVAEQILQDTFLRIWQRIETYSSSKGRLVTWILSIARNKAIDVVRLKSYQRAALSVPLTEVRKTVEMDQTMTAYEVRAKVSGLEKKYRTLIELIYFEGYTQAEASKKLGLPLGTVKSRVRKAMQELRETYAE